MPKYQSGVTLLHKMGMAPNMGMGSMIVLLGIWAGPHMEGAPYMYIFSHCSCLWTRALGLGSWQVESLLQYKGVLGVW
jgi:hypothetical protein